MTKETEKLLDLAQASAMLNTIKGIQDNFCARYRKCVGCPIGSDLCVQYEINLATRRIDNVYFAEVEKCKKQ